ncbi:MAG: methyltransferase domain-containing protein [Bacteroidales bacterium]|nr:methyltransferase domain-containing protein [Bacteroidales bacterium]
MKELWISKIKKAKLHDKDTLIKQLLADKTVLDVGCVGQDFNYQSENWLHGKIKKVTRLLVGVDTNYSGIDTIRKHNKEFTIYTPKELQEKSISFDYILMADVIEHVDNTTDFLNFYKQFLNSEGKIIITTPNPFSASQFFSIFFFGQPSFHPEHTCYIDPINMLELANRANLRLVEFHWLSFYTKPTKWYRKIIYILSQTLIKVRKYYAPNYIFILN